MSINTITLQISASNIKIGTTYLGKANYQEVCQIPSSDYLCVTLDKELNLSESQFFNLQIDIILPTS